MTVADHRRIGLALGYPACCVEQFAKEAGAGGLPALERGGVHCGHRTEPARVFGPSGQTIDGPGEEIVYVPCDDHSGFHVNGWRPYAENLVRGSIIAEMIGRQNAALNVTLKTALRV